MKTGPKKPRRKNKERRRRFTVSPRAGPGGTWRGGKDSRSSAPCFVSKTLWFIAEKVLLSHVALRGFLVWASRRSAIIRAGVTWHKWGAGVDINGVVDCLHSTLSIIMASRFELLQESDYPSGTGHIYAEQVACICTMMHKSTSSKSNVSISGRRMEKAEDAEGRAAENKAVV